MGVRIKLLELAAGGTSEFDHSYLKEYDPTRLTVDGGYDGGLLTVTREPAEARVFPSVSEALEYWRQSYGIRPWDGKPNRPLTAWTVTIERE